MLLPKEQNDELSYGIHVPVVLQRQFRKSGSADGVNVQSH